MTTEPPKDPPAPADANPPRVASPTAPATEPAAGGHDVKAARQQRSAAGGAPTAGGAANPGGVQTPSGASPQNPAPTKDPSADNSPATPAAPADDITAALMPLGEALRTARTVIVIGIIGSLPLLYFAAFTQQLDAQRAALWVLATAAIGVGLLLLGTVIRLLTKELLVSLREDGLPRFERHWGGLGGTVGGWTLSRSLVSLLGLALALTALLVVLGQVTSLSGFLLGKDNAVERPSPSVDSESNDESAAASTSGGTEGNEPPAGNEQSGNDAEGAEE